jgi:hypothetical protein
MPEGAIAPSKLGPSPVAIHYDGDVLGQIEF